MPYMMGGFPDDDTSAAVAAAYVDAGADLVELGVPFSDPLADGPVIHAAAHGRSPPARPSIRSSRSAARSRTGCRSSRWSTRTWSSPGARRVRARLAADGGPAGAIVPDLPLGGGRRGIGEALNAARARADPAGRADDAGRRRRRICADARGSSTWSRTRARPASATSFRPALGELVAAAKADAAVPVAVGFGIGTPEQAAEVGASPTA